MILAMFLSLLIAAASAEGELQVKGRCDYSETVREKAGDTVLVTCNAVTLRERAGNFEIAFGQRSFDTATIFHGFDADGPIEIDRITLANGSTYDAEGTCEIVYRGGRMSGASCLVRARGTFYAANFIANRIDP